MPYVLYHEEGRVVALDETGPRLIMTQWDDDLNQDVLWAVVPLPANGIEILDCNVGKRPQSEPEVVNFTTRTETRMPSPYRLHSRPA